MEKEHEYEAAKQRLERERSRMTQSRALDEQLLAAQRVREELALREKHLELQRQRKQEELELAQAQLAAEYEERRTLKEKEQLASQKEIERQFHTAELNLNWLKLNQSMFNLVGAMYLCMFIHNQMF